MRANLSAKSHQLRSSYRCTVQRVDSPSSHQHKSSLLDISRSIPFIFKVPTRPLTTNTSPHAIHTQAEPASNDFRTKELTVKWTHSHCAHFEIPSITAGPLAYHHTQPTSSISFILHEQNTLHPRRNHREYSFKSIASTVAGKLYTPTPFVPSTQNLTITKAIVNFPGHAYINRPH